ncbi:hypothetical protein KFE80_09015 [bacterium SCSIO 12696]|nr:hypothetical protein KFE80_09015 [bacterium SCSIO 12696]
MTVFILQNQHHQYLGKDGEWLDGCDANALFRSPHYDIALNQLVEANAKDYALRGVVVSCDVDSRGRPLLQQDEPQKPLEESNQDCDADAQPSAAATSEQSAELATS